MLTVSSVIADTVVSEELAQYDSYYAMQWEKMVPYFARDWWLARLQACLDTLEEGEIASGATREKIDTFTARVKALNSEIRTREHANSH